MLGLMRKKQETETVIDLSENQLSKPTDLELSAKLKAALIAIEDGQQVDLTDIPEDIATPILQLANAIQSRNENALTRAVALSVNASNSMAAVALITGDVREIESSSNTMASAIEELDASISQISETAQAASSKMQNANELMSNGLTNIRSTNEAAQTTSTAMNSMEQQTKAVSDAVTQISNFVGTIDEIAQQTNLLALNATIEAARAGDAGKGFAVVAAEVKTLSTATQKATEDINSRIIALQNDVGHLLQSFEQANGSVANTQELTETTETNIEEIAAIINDTANGMSNIANLLNEQTHATSELAQGVNKIADGSVKASAMANEVIDAVKASEQVVEQLFTALDGRNIKNYVLNRAKSDHFLWKKNVAEMLVGLNNLKQAELADHHSCRLGKWCSSTSNQTIINHPSFKTLEQPHQEVHDFGRLAAAEFAKGNLEGSQKAFKDMQAASHKVVDILDELINR